MKVYLDTFVFMDLLSGSEFAVKAESYVRKPAVVSSVLFTELAYHIARRKRTRASEILFYLQSLPNIEIVPVDEEIAKLAGLLRAKYRKRIGKKLTYFDCIHLATAIRSGCSRFITGDRGFREITEIEMEIY